MLTPLTTSSNNLTHKEEAAALVGHAGAYRNNCAFHCVVHTWLNLPAATIRQLYDSKPIYKEILQTFCEHYQLPQFTSVTQFLALMNTPAFAHPYNREIIWGGVLRAVVKKLFKPTLQMASLMDDADIALLVNAMGANLKIQYDGYCLDNSVAGAVFSVEMRHTVKGGGHFEVVLPAAITRGHNARFGSPVGTGERPPVGDLRFYFAASVVGVKEQDEAIRGLVRSLVVPNAVTDSQNSPEEPPAKRARVERAATAPTPVSTQAAQASTSTAQASLDVMQATAPTFTPQADAMGPLSVQAMLTAQPLVRLRRIAAYLRGLDAANATTTPERSTPSPHK